MEKAGGASITTRSESPGTEGGEELPPLVFDTREELLAAIKKQVEYYFSKENLQSDNFLVSKMDNNMAVHISVVMRFAKLKRLTQSEADIREALTTSKSVVISDDKIRATIKNERNTIILREIPSDTAEDAIRAIFDGIRPVKSIRSDVGDTWFVAMESEEDAMEALLAIRPKTFNGHPIKARLKSENVLRSFFTTPAPAMEALLPPPSAGPFLPYPFAMQMMPPSPYAYPPPAYPHDRPVPQPQHLVRSSSNVSLKSTTSEKSRDNGQTHVHAHAHTHGHTTPVTAPKSSMSSNPRQGKEGRDSSRAAHPAAQVQPPSNRKENRRKADKSKANPQTERTAPAKEEARPRSDSTSRLHLTPANFPPLHIQQEIDPHAPTSIPKPGYHTPHISYTQEEIIRIVQRLSTEEVKITDVNPLDHPLAMDATPNNSLHRRQRTFSIDETHEQLRQGRPVQRTAVASPGESDYGALMYGDNHEKQPDMESHKATVHPQQTISKPQGYAAVLMSGPKVKVKEAPADSTSSCNPNLSPVEKASESGLIANHKAHAVVAPPPTQPSTADMGSTEAPKPKGSGRGKSGRGKKKGGSKDASKDSKETHTSEQNGQARKEEMVEKPSSWGGRPTFVDVLKASQEKSSVDKSGTNVGAIVLEAPTSNGHAEDITHEDP